MTRRTRLLAVAGCGGAAFGIHLPILAAHQAFEVVAVADKDRRRAEHAAHAFGVSRVAADAAYLLAGTDMLVVLTPVHEPLIETALAAGTHVFTEKPVSLDVERTRRLRRRAMQAGLLLEVGAMRAHDPAVHALLEAVAPDHVRGGTLIKIDGADEQARRAVLPKGFAAYTLADQAPAAVPSRFGAIQRRALEILLWQGYHVLTLLVLATARPRPVTCVLDGDSGSNLHAVVSGENGAVFSVVVGEGPTGTYLDQARLTGSRRTGCVEFGPPYGPGNPARLTVQPTNAGSPEIGYPSPFTRMWDAIDARLHGHIDAGPDTGAIAESVEQLAADLASVAETSSPPTTVRSAP